MAAPFDDFDAETVQLVQSMVTLAFVVVMAWAQIFGIAPEQITTHREAAAPSECSETSDASDASPSRRRKRGKMAMVAHRGSSHTAPENTLASMNLAFKQGACGVEFDIQKSADGEIFLLHDDTLRRTAKATCPPSLNMSEEEYQQLLDKDVSCLSYWDFIRHVDVGSWKGEQYSCERPCLMTDAMDTLPEGCFALCEVKGGDMATAQAVTALAKEKGWAGEQLTFIGFDMELMTDIKARLVGLGLSSIDVIYVQDAYEEAKAIEVIQAAKAAGLDGVDFEADPSVVTPKVVQAAAAEGLQTGVWVWDKLPHSDTHPNAMHLAGCGVDFFTSDLPPAIHEWICVR